MLLLQEDSRGRQSLTVQALRYAPAQGPVSICASKEIVSAPSADGRGARTTETVAPAVVSCPAAAAICVAREQSRILKPLLVIADLSQSRRYGKDEAQEPGGCTLNKHRANLMNTVRACNKEGPVQKEAKAGIDRNKCPRGNQRDIPFTENF